MAGGGAGYLGADRFYEILWRHRGLPVRLSQPVPDPTGLHHLIWSPFVFTSIGGQLLIDGQTVIGAKPIFLAEIARHPVDALSDSARF